MEIADLPIPPMWKPSKGFWKRWLFCRWFHEEHRCFPEVWGRGLKGPWHCAKCHPCDEGLTEYLDSLRE